MIELPTPTGLLPLAAAHFIEACDIPEVNVDVIDLMQVEAVTKLQDIGAPKFNVWLDDTQKIPTVHLAVELKPEIRSEQNASIHARIEDHLFINDHIMRQYFESGDFRVEIHLVGPESLAEYIPG